MTPMFSAYVVVGEPPTELVMTVARPSAAIARPITGSRSVPVISATALTWPAFSAISAITAGSTSRMKANLKSGRCQPATSLPSAPVVVCGGNPNHEAAFTPDQSTRSWLVACVAPPSTDVIGPAVRSSSQDSRYPKTRPTKIAIRLMKPRTTDGDHHHERHRGQRHPLVLRPVDGGHHRREVEPDQHDHRAGDHRRQHCVQHLEAEEVDDHADHGQDRAGDQDRAGHRGRSPPCARMAMTPPTNEADVPR